MPKYLEGVRGVGSVGVHWVNKLVLGMYSHAPEREKDVKSRPYIREELA